MTSLLENYLNELYSGQRFVPSYKVNELENKLYTKIGKELLNDLDDLFFNEEPTEFDKELKRIFVIMIGTKTKLKITWT